MLAANFWRFNPPDPDAVRAVALYTEILNSVNIIGHEYSSLTTTLGSYAVKKVSEDPVAAALMVRLLKDSGAVPDAVAAINASGSFPGFSLAALSACAVLGIETYVIASVGASTYGANIPGNTIADMLLTDDVRRLGFTLLAVTPGGSNDRGQELDPDELERIEALLRVQGIPFIRPAGLEEAIAVRESLFGKAGCSLLVNIGGTHASSGANTGLALLSGIITPDSKLLFDDPGLMQSFLRQGMPVIQILNVRALYSSYGLEFDQTGKITQGRDRALRR